MQQKIPEISKELKIEDVNNLLNIEHEKIQHKLVAFHIEWMRMCYADFKDHDTFIIIVYLVNQTMEFYNRNLVNITFDDYYAKNYLEIDKINILQLSRDLNIPKETTRRKILELQKLGVIKKNKKNIIIDRNAFKFVKPTNTVRSLSSILSTITKLLYKKRILNFEYETSNVEDSIKKNFTFCWHHFYKYQIPFIINMKRIFKEVDVLHIWGVIYLNKIYNIVKKKENLDKENFNKALYTAISSEGINAMSISDMTGIPRPTVIRKLKYLMKRKHIYCDNKKLYHLSKEHFDQLNSQQKFNLNSFAELATKIINKNIISIYSSYK